MSSELIAELKLEIERLNHELKGPDGFATWKDAAIAERVRRVTAEKLLETYKEDFLLTDEQNASLRESLESIRGFIESDAPGFALKRIDEALTNR